MTKLIALVIGTLFALQTKFSPEQITRKPTVLEWAKCEVGEPTNCAGLEYFKLQMPDGSLHAYVTRSGPNTVTLDCEISLCVCQHWRQMPVQ